LGYAKRLLGCPNETLQNPVEVATDRPEKEQLRDAAWKLWCRLENGPKGSLNAPEHGFDNNFVNIAKMGK